MNGELRIGRVSRVIYEKGMIEVVYADRDNSVTGEIPMLDFNGIYQMPKLGSMVIVAHLSNGDAVALGTFWNQSNRPSKSGKGLCYKDLGNVSLQCQNGVLIMQAEQIQLITKEGIKTF